MFPALVAGAVTGLYDAPAPDEGPERSDEGMNVEDIDESLDDELDEEIEEPELEEEPIAAVPPAEGEEVESIQELLVRQEAREAEPEPEGSLLALTPDEITDETLTVKVEPPRSNEFTCSKCHLVKHRSQLKDKAKMLCRDCA
jgi:hypothetical protein